MVVDKTDEWIDWANWKITRPEAATNSATCLPVRNPTTGEWHVYQPNSDISMIVSEEEYLNWFNGKLNRFNKILRNES